MIYYHCSLITTFYYPPSTLNTMYTLIGIFYASLLGIILMLLLKRHEVNTGRPNIISRLGRGSDSMFGWFFSSTRRAVSYANRHTFIALAQWIAFHILVHVRNVYVELKDLALKNQHTKKVIDMVRGKGEVSNHGASFYLRQISMGDK